MKWTIRSFSLDVSEAVTNINDIIIIGLTINLGEPVARVNVGNLNFWKPQIL